MQELTHDAQEIISEYFGESYLFGEGSTEKLGSVLASFGEGKRIALIMSSNDQEWNKKLSEKLRLSLVISGVQIYGGTIRSARQGAPSDDVMRIATTLEEIEPQVVVCIGGESALNAAKIANAYWRLKDIYPQIEELEGEEKITQKLEKLKRHTAPLVAFSTSLSPSHLTTLARIYSLSEKRMLIIKDQTINPAKSLFDPFWLKYLPAERVRDSALEAFSICLEAYLCYKGEYEEYIEYTCLKAIELILRNSQRLLEEDNFETRECIALASHISGIILMISETNCGHLNFATISDKWNRTHICAVLNPYYLVLYSQGIADKLAKIAEVMKRCGFNPTVYPADSRSTAESVASEIQAFLKALNLPTSLAEFNGFSETNAMSLMEDAKKELTHKGFKNIPVELNLINVNKHLRLLYQAAYLGDWSIIITP